MGELDGGHEMTPEDVAALMQAAESGYAPAQNAYANVINNVEGNMLAAAVGVAAASRGCVPRGGCRCGSLHFVACYPAPRLLSCLYAEKGYCFFRTGRQAAWVPHGADVR